jgi:F-type H+-transporting ATPase subunit a
VRKALTILIAVGAVVALCGPLTGFLYSGGLGKSPYGALPVVSLPAEAIPIPWFGGKMSNTFFTTLIIDVLLLLLVGLGLRHARRGDIRPPQGVLGGMVEMISEALANFADNVAGARGKAIFPLVATLFFFILVGNWFKLLPGAESIGILETPHLANIPAYAPRQIVLGPLSFYTVDGTHPVEVDHGEAEAHAEPAAEAHAAEGICTACNITPFIRGVATDLNFTLALALVTMALVQAWGFRSQGLRYLVKFINIPALSKGPIGVIEFAAGLLEIISEFSRIISFAFRLLGNIFAGTVLIFVMSNLIPFILPAGFYGLELFVGAIQAVVFALLALVFINMATQGHGDGSHAAQGEPAHA